MEEEKNIILNISDIMSQYDVSKENQIKEIVIDFNISETISLPKWIQEENLNMVLGAGDCVIPLSLDDRTSDIERIDNSFNIFVCLPDAPLKMILSNINYIISNKLKKIICFIDLKDNTKVEKFIKTFENKINMIGFGGGHFVSLPNHKCFGQLLKQDGYSFLHHDFSGLNIGICDTDKINTFINYSFTPLKI